MTHLDKPSRSVTRLTVGQLGPGHGKDRGRKLAVSLLYGDLILIRPHGTRRARSVLVTDVYDYMIRCEANKARREKDEIKRAKKADAARRRQLLRSIRA